MNQDQEYTSGLGKESVVPPEIKGWSWGAFLLNWIWGIGNSTYIALLMFVPLVNIVMLFVLGAKGNKWAWQNRTWRDVEHFKKTQKKWSIAGAILVFVFLPLFVISISSMLKGEAFDLSLKAINSNSEVAQLIGKPIESGFFVTGSIEISGSTGQASLQYSISGPKGEAEAYVLANKEIGQWNLNKVVVYQEEQGLEIQVIAPKQ
jgi:hypothetical protein